MNYTELTQESMDELIKVTTQTRPKGGQWIFVTERLANSLFGHIPQSKRPFGWTFFKEQEGFGG